MASFPRLDDNQHSHCIPQMSHLYSVNTMDYPPPPPNLPQLNPPPSLPGPRNPQTLNIPSLNPPSFMNPLRNQPILHRTPRMSPLPLNHPLVHETTLNPPVGFIHHAPIPTGVPRQQMQHQIFNPPNLNHPAVLEFTFVLEYMGDRIAIHTDQPTRFQILYLCNVASSALHNEFSPPNHIFRPMVAPRWLGRMVRVHSDALLRVIVHQCISRGEFRLYIWVYFIAHGSLQHLPGMVVNSSEFPAIHDLGGLPQGHKVQHVSPIVSNHDHSRESQLLPPPISNLVHGHDGQSLRPVVSNLVEVVVVESASQTAAPPVAVPINTPRPAVASGEPNNAIASQIRTVVPPHAEVVMPPGGNEQSNERRKYKCQNCGRVGHIKCTCKLVNPILTKACARNEGEV